MVDMANTRGGPDNISVIVARVEAVEDPSWPRELTGRIGRAWRRWVRSEQPDPSGQR
jgi:serine/threonine protein phosphatase PrpC